MTIRLEGFDTFDKRLADLKKATERSVLRRVAKAALTPVMEAAQSLAPVAQGDLRESIVIGSKLTRGARKNERGRDRDGVRLWVGTSNPAAVPQEFGTVRMRGVPFMRPAWDAEQENVLRIVGDELETELTKAAQRAARRTGK